VLWLFGGAAPSRGFAEASIAALSAHGASLDVLTPRDASARYPQIDARDIAVAMLEPEAGYLMARRACEDVIEQFQRQGGTYRLAAAAAPVDIGELRRGRLGLNDGTYLEADAFVLACGPWLRSLVPDVLGPLISPTRQEVYYFGPPAGDMRFTDAALPAWIEVSEDQIYGIPGNTHRGFKIADDRPGPVIDPTTADRDATPAGIAAMRGYLARRFPALASAPLTGSEVCQYEASPDSELIIDRHPSCDDVWLVGGGSGHGFKLGPAVGELVADAVLNGGAVAPRFSLARFSEPRPAAWEEKWR
jgi:glycine/D-amino acid oxidase-like deaminating enzyme